MKSRTSPDGENILYTLQRVIDFEFINSQIKFSNKSQDRRRDFIQQNLSLTDSLSSIVALAIGSDIANIKGVFSVENYSKDRLTIQYQEEHFSDSRALLDEDIRCFQRAYLPNGIESFDVLRTALVNDGDEDIAALIISTVQNLPIQHAVLFANQNSDYVISAAKSNGFKELTDDLLYFHNTNYKGFHGKI